MITITPKLETLLEGASFVRYEITEHDAGMLWRIPETKKVLVGDFDHKKNLLIFYAADRKKDGIGVKNLKRVNYYTMVNIDVEGDELVLRAKIAESDYDYSYREYYYTFHLGPQLK